MNMSAMLSSIITLTILLILVFYFYSLTKCQRKKWTDWVWGGVQTKPQIPEESPKIIEKANNELKNDDAFYEENYSINPKKIAEMDVFFDPKANLDDL